jgi:hypothetical protein
VVNDDTLVTHVKCKICTKAMGKKQLLGPKFDSLRKNVGKKKATSTMLSVDNDAFYWAKDNQHANNELLFVNG